MKEEAQMEVVRKWWVHVPSNFCDSLVLICDIYVFILLCVL
jgi:hypothetical protein